MRRLSRMVLSSLVALTLAAPAFAQENGNPPSSNQTNQTSQTNQAPPPVWWPFASATANTFVPGLGFVMIGDQYAALATSGLVSGFVSLAALNTPPMVTIYRQPSSLFALTAQETVFTSSYLVYQQARLQNKNQGFSHPLVVRELPALIFAPVQREQFLDRQVWTNVGLVFLSSELISLAYEGTTGTITSGILRSIRSGRSVFNARSAQLGGWTTSPAVGYGVHLGGSLLVGAHAGIGEEALFRGIIQEEGERLLGPWGGLAIASGLFGLAHAVGGSGNPRQVVYTTVGGVLDGLLYQQSGYDLSKPIAAHTYWDALLFAISGLFPDENGRTIPLGIRYTF
ncbi:MAG: lysostaphin resistance A-like protein [Bacteroidota bacterium]